jgi:hypothetical protein
LLVVGAVVMVTVRDHFENAAPLFRCDVLVVDFRLVFDYVFNVGGGHPLKLN